MTTIRTLRDIWHSPILLGTLVFYHRPRMQFSCVGTTPYGRILSFLNTKQVYPLCIGDFQSSGFISNLKFRSDRLELVFQHSDDSNFSHSN